MRLVISFWRSLPLMINLWCHLLFMFLMLLVSWLTEMREKMDACIRWIKSTTSSKNSNRHFHLRSSRCIGGDHAKSPKGNC